MEKLINTLIIVGETLDGQRFRPSDWAERLCGVMKCFEDEVDKDSHLYYSAFVKPITYEGTKSVAIDIRLKTELPMAYDFFLDFAKSNHLKTTES